jgi:1-acyl-sn-glycerol-3-phosphate acyltransferase
LAIVAGYIVVFWIALPVGLWATAQTLDRVLDWNGTPWTAGLAITAAGMGLLIWGMVELWRGAGGLPVSALPPAHLMRRGPYRYVRHPMYLGFNVAIFGAGLTVGSTALTWLVAPAFVPAWLIYARWEERGLVRRFGSAYRRYQHQVGLLPHPGLYRLTQGLVFLRVFQVDVVGRDQVPKRGPAILIFNHSCYLDPVFVGAVTGRVIHFMTTAEAYRPGVLGWLVRRFPNVPVRRYRPDPVACREILRLLAEGELIALAPEGERTVLGQYQGAQPEVAGILARLGVPVVPVGVNGSHDAGPRWADTLRRRRIRVRVGPTIEWNGADPAALIDQALRSLLTEDPQRVYLEGLPPERLERILWRCPVCFDGVHWRAPALTCAWCQASFRPTATGMITDREGQLYTLAALGARVRTAPERFPLAVPASGWEERSMFGPIEALQQLGAGVLTIELSGLRFGELFIAIDDIRNVSTERADTLQVATRDGMWQFQPQHDSVFRLQALLERRRELAAQQFATVRAIRSARPYEGHDAPLGDQYRGADLATYRAR